MVSMVVVLRKTAVGDLHFNGLSCSHLQSQVTLKITAAEAIEMLVTNKTLPQDYLTETSGSQPGVHGPLGGLQTIFGGLPKLRGRLGDCTKGTESAEGNWVFFGK